MSFKFITYNILDGGLGREALLLETLQPHRADLILLQEVIDEAVVKSLAQALGLYYFVSQSNSKRRLALLSRWPIATSSSYRPFPPIRHALLEATLEYQPQRFIHILGVHLLPHFFIGCELWRYWEVAVILRRVRQEMPCLLAGDFNAVAPHDRVITAQFPERLKAMLRLQRGKLFHYAVAKVLAAGFYDSYRQIHPHQDGFTLPTPQPHIRLDYIFVNELLRSRLQNCTVITDPSAVHRASDHHPLMAEFT